MSERSPDRVALNCELAGLAGLVVVCAIARALWATFVVVISKRFADVRTLTGGKFDTLRLQNNCQLNEFHTH